MKQSNLLFVLTFFVISLPQILWAMPSASEVSSEQETTDGVSESTETEISEDTESEEDTSDLDTAQAGEIGLTGNWIKKKDLLLKSYELSDEINNVAVKIQSSRKMFHEKYTVMDDMLDDFYKELGLEQGKIHTLFQSIAKYLKKKKTKREEELKQQKEKSTLKDRDYIINIEIIEEEIKKHQRSLQQLQLDMKSVEDLDKSLTARLKKLDEQISQAAEITKISQEKTTKLWQILDHTKARQVYFELKGKNLQQLNAINTYLNETLLQDFESVSQTIKQQMSRVKQQVAGLEKQGFIIQNRVQRIGSIKQKDAAKEAIEKKKNIPQKATLKKIMVKKNATWYEKIYHSVVAYVAKIYQFFKSFLFPRKKITTNTHTPSKSKASNNTNTKPLEPNGAISTEKAS